MDFIKRYKKQIMICAGVAIGIIITLVIVFILVRPKKYTIDVKVIQWDYTVYIQEYKVVHYTNRISYPSDAYNVKSHRETKTKTVTDSDGKTRTITEHETVYEYDVNKWVDTRTVGSHGFDHEPYFAEVTLKESHRDDNIGAERISSHKKEYYASGTFVNSSDEELHTIVIPYKIWDVLKVSDQLNYEQRTIGKPFNIQIAQ